jgi:uncharacterized protein (DUF2235 family)
MLHIVGLLFEDNEGLIPYAIRMIKDKHMDFKVAADFKKTFSRECKPHFVGVWDTVSSLGWVYNAVHFPYTNATNNADLSFVRHAISIDERRAFFRRNSFGAPQNATQDVLEVWFAGVHSDVGGSYPESESQLSKISLQWMLSEARVAGLLVDSDRAAEVLGAKTPYVRPDPLTKNQHESLRGLWWIAEVWPKIVHKQESDGAWHSSLRINLGRKRWIPKDSVFHESVRQRMAQADLRYMPSNLPERRRFTSDRVPPTKLVSPTP